MGSSNVQNAINMTRHIGMVMTHSKYIAFTDQGKGIGASDENGLVSRPSGNACALWVTKTATHRYDVSKIYVHFVR